MNYFNKNINGSNWRISQCCQFHDKILAKRYNFGTVTKTYALKEGGKEKVQAKALDNCKKLVDILDTYFAKQPINLRSFRISSQLFPCYTLEFAKPWYEEIWPNIEKLLSYAGTVAKNNSIRLSTHPAQFTVLGSNNADVVANSILDLEYHALFGSLMHLDPEDFVMNIHLQGLYGGKHIDGINRFAKNFDYLSDYAKKCLAVENEDKHKAGYNINHVLELCDKIPTRATLDIHHYECMQQKEGDWLTANDSLFQSAVKTWKNSRPLFHISQTIIDKNGIEGRMNAHSDILHDRERLSNFVPMLQYADFDIEAKFKEVAVKDAYSYILEEELFAGENITVKNCY